MKQKLWIAICMIACLSCKKETVQPNTAPGTVTGFSISYGSSTVFDWSDATDPDGDAVTYELYLLNDTGSKPFLVAKDLTTSQYSTSVHFLGVTKAMIVVVKDGKGGVTTSVEAPTIIL
jgi:hypothetical protein